MPIVSTNGVIVETAVVDKDQFDRTGVIRADQFAVCDKTDKTKQIKLGCSGQAAGTTVTLIQSATVADIATPASATAEDCANKINALLAALRTAGFVKT